MDNLIRFGRKVTLPSTIEIKHDLRMMAAADKILAATHVPQTEDTREQLEHVVGDLAAQHGLSRERAAVLVARFGLTQSEGAAQNLDMTKADG